MPKPTAIAYIDGFNLYNRSLKGRDELKWLDLVRLCERILPEFELTTVHYFTAHIKPSAHIDAQAPLRQQIYLRALAASDPRLEVTLGQFEARFDNRVSWPKTKSPDGNSWLKSKVMLVNEKGSDVNLASRMVADSISNACDTVFLVSTDSDFAGTLKMLTVEFARNVGLILPFEENRKSSREMRNLPLSQKYRMTLEDLLSSQLPPHLRDEHGKIRKPAAWLNAEDPE